MKFGAVMLALVAVTSASGPSGPLAFAISAEDAPHVVGQRKIVCGDISAKTGLPATDTGPIIFPVGRPAPDEVLTIRIPASNRRKFSPLVGRRLLGRQVCVEGTIAPAPGPHGHLIVDVSEVKQFKFIGAPPPLPEGFAAGAVTLGDAGVIQPVPIRTVNPNYTSAPEAMRARVQGSVGLVGVVGVNGSVHSLEVVDSLDPLLGLDDAALQAASEWAFRSAMRAGQSTPFLEMLDMNFVLPKTGPAVDYPLVQSAARIEAVAGGRSGSVSASFHTVPGLARIARVASPRYPIEALQRGWEGDVILAVATDADGRMIDAKIKTMPPDAPAGVEAEALKCLTQWRFSPGKIDGKSVPSTREIVLYFSFHKH